MKKNQIKIIVAAIVALLVIAGGFIGFHFFYRPSTVSQISTDGATIFHSLNITKTDLDIELEDLQAVLMSAKATPYRNDNEDIILGFQLTEIQSNSVWTKFGFQDGDIINAVNGTKLDNASSAMGIYTTLLAATKIQFQVTRNQSLGLIEVTIQHD